MLNVCVATMQRRADARREINGGEMRLIHAALTTAMMLAVAGPAFADNGAPSGPHYNLNIIGVSKAKTQDLTGSNRNTIFVALGTKSSAVTSKIYLYQGADFNVCDGNAFDAAIDCAGNPIGNNLGAVFQLPCNLNLTLDGADAIAPCDGGAEDSYAVYARALGRPGGSAVITTCATEVTDVDGDGTLDVECSTENTLDVLTRKNGQSLFQNVTNELTSLVACIDQDPDPTVVDLFCTRYALFRDEFTDFFWQYDNKGLRLAQVRFYRLDDINRP
jgi:hypothetical protein